MEDIVFFLIFLNEFILFLFMEGNYLRIFMKLELIEIFTYLK